VVSFEVVGGQSVVYVIAELFGGEMSSVSFVNVVDCLVEEVFRWCVVGWVYCVVWEPLVV
jgi:hypothetical protein